YGISTGTGNQFFLNGYRLNGVTEGAYYGDDAQMGTNYPLIRFKNMTPTSQYYGNYFYGITYGLSKTGIEAPGDTTLMMTSFKMSNSFYSNLNNVYNGQYLVEVVVNGIASSLTPWTLTKTGTSNSWRLGAPGGGALAAPNGGGFRAPVGNQATVLSADSALTVV